MPFNIKPNCWKIKRLKHLQSMGRNWEHVRLLIASALKIYGTPCVPPRSATQTELSSALDILNSWSVAEAKFRLISKRRTQMSSKGSTYISFVACQAVQLCRTSLFYIKFILTTTIDMACSRAMNNLGIRQKISIRTDPSIQDHFLWIIPIGMDSNPIMQVDYHFLIL